MAAWKSLKMNPKRAEKKLEPNPKAIIYNADATWNFTGLGLPVPLVQGQQTPK